MQSQVGDSITVPLTLLCGLLNALFLLNDFRSQFLGLRPQGSSLSP